MLEEIALSISTAIFFICTAIVSAVLPMPPADIEIPTEAVSRNDGNVEHPAVFTSASPFDIVGEWSCNGKTFVFTRDGKLLFGDHIINYSFADGKVTVIAAVGGEKREYRLNFERVDEGVMKLNGTPFYRVK